MSAVIAPQGWVVRDPRAIEGRVDWSRWYLTDEDDMGEGGEQNHIIRVFTSSLERLLELRGREEDHHVGVDQFFAWMEQEPLVRVSPDVYLLDFRPGRPLPPSWQTWQPGHRPPRFALEVVSAEWAKDYEENPLKYAQLGCRELVIFDPTAAGGGAPRTRERVALQLFRRREDGAFVLVHSGAGPVHSQELDAWLVVRPLSGTADLRLAHDAGGRDLVPTHDEALAEKDRVLEEKDRVLEEKDRVLEEKDRVLEEKDRVLLEERAARQRLEAELKRLRQG